MRTIALYIPTLYHGGAERVVSRLSYILKDDYKIYIILNEEKIYYKVNCEIINLNVPAKQNIIKKIISPITRTKKLKKVKKELNIDCTISFLTNANIVNGLSKIKGSSVIYSIRNFSEIKRQESLYGLITDALIKRLYKRANVIVPVSEVIANGLTLKGIEEEKINVIYNPYDIGEIINLSKEGITDKKHMEFLQEGIIFSSMGRLSYQKGFWHLIKAFSLIPEEKNAKLVIIGSGEHERKIEKLITDLQLQGKVLLTGYQQNPFKYIAHSDIYVLSSLFEGFPNALVEAMSCGKPVIAADCRSGPREILIDNDKNEKALDEICYGDYGILIPELNEGENWDSKIITDKERIITEAMLKLIDNKDLYSKYVLRSSLRAEQFNYDVCRKKYNEVIEYAIKKGRSK